MRSGFISKESHVFVEKEDNPSEKVVIFEEELYCVGNLANLPGLVFINSKCIKYLLMVETLLEILSKGS